MKTTRVVIWGMRTSARERAALDCKEYIYTTRARPGKAGQEERSMTRKAKEKVFSLDFFRKAGAAGGAKHTPKKIGTEEARRIALLRWENQRKKN